MGDVVHIMKPIVGDKSFLTCGCGDGDTMAVVVLHDAHGAFISVLVCPGCFMEIPIAFGRPA